MRSLPTARLTVDGRRLVDPLGRTVVLRGVNAGGRSKFAPFVPFEVPAGGSFQATLSAAMDQLAGWGLNVLRLPFSWEALEPEPGRLGEVWLGRYEAMVDAAWVRGMRCIVDFHQDVYASPMSGDGFPPWTLPEAARGPARRDAGDGQWFMQYMDPAGPVAQAFDRLWSNDDGLLDRFEGMWRTMARRLGGRPGVVGFEAINEPGWGSRPIPEFERDVLTPVLARLGAAIQEEAPGALVFAGGSGADALTATTWLDHPGTPGFVYAPHFYQAPVALGAPMVDPDGVSAGIARLAAAGERMGCPVLFGEYGAGAGSPDAARFMRLAHDAFDALGCHATAWEVSWSADLWNHENLGLTEPDGTERPALDAVVRPYARAVDGRVERMAWDPEAGVFELVVGAAGPAPGEVWLPARHLGAAPRLALEGAAAVQEGELAVVTASAPRWRLEARPGVVR